MTESQQGGFTSQSLASESLLPCRKGDSPLSMDATQPLLTRLTDWSLDVVDDIPRLVRVFRFRDFVEALAFANRVGELAEQAGHHPALLVEWGRVTVSWWTHDIGGLHRNDVIMAARTDVLHAGA